MKSNGSTFNNARSYQSLPLWLLAELTYRCPLQCPYCSNPCDFSEITHELTTKEWIHVLHQARALGATQLGLSGGEPLVRQDLEDIITHARQLGFYINLITSGVGMNEQRLIGLINAGVDNFQISLQGHTQEINDFLAGTPSFQHKLFIMNKIKSFGFPLVLNVVLHRHNIDYVETLLKLALTLKADYLELANAQYYGFAMHNRTQLLPTKLQVEKAEAIAHQYQTLYKKKMKIYYVISDYYENKPKPCMNGWGNVFLTVAPDGIALPCQAARQLPNMDFPNVKSHSLKWIWQESALFNEFRGFEWMKEPCRSCPEKYKDFGGCRCQSYQLTGDAKATDPACHLSPHHHLIESAISSSLLFENEKPLLFRNRRNSKKLQST